MSTGTKPAGSNGQRAKILVADDEPAIREFEGHLLTEWGHEVVAASNGEEAVRLAHAHRPQLLLLDLAMPGLSGIEVCRQLRGTKETRNIRIIVVSGMDAKVALEESILAGADDFLAKPIEPLELSVRVRSMLRTRNIRDEPKWLEAYVHTMQELRAR